MAHISDETRIRHEHAWANRAVKVHADAVDRGLWFSLRYSSRTHAHNKKRYVVWTPGEVLDVLRLVEVSVSTDYGLSAVFQRRDETHFIASSTPSRLPGLDVFFWLPAFNEVRWCPENWEQPGGDRILRVAVNYKQTRSLADGPVEGLQYVSEMADFIRLNPEHENTKF